MTATGDQIREQILVRVSPETYTALQLAQPFVRKRSMQDLVAYVLHTFLDQLRSEDEGYQQALAGLRESEARSTGVLARRRAQGGRRNGTQ